MTKKRSALTPRELDVTEFILQALTEPRIAEVMGISIHTVRTHVKRIYSYYGVHTQGQCILAIQRERDGWKPIETAPKDGTPILAVCKGWYSEDLPETHRVVVKWTGEYSGWSIPGISGLTCTHWRPLPAPPVIQTSVEPSNE